MVEWQRLDLPKLFDQLKSEINDWDPPQVIPRTQKLGKFVKNQMENYKEGKFRKDRNEAIGFFDAIDKFANTDLPLSLDHFTQLIVQYKGRFNPYPHYSGIKVSVPQVLRKIDEVEISDIPPPKPEKEEDEDEESSLKLM